jgi:uncharacterized integral membrane protein
MVRPTDTHGECPISRQFSALRVSLQGVAFAVLVFRRMKILFKTVFTMAVLLLLVLMGMHNRSPVDFSLPPVLKQTLQQPAALMYFAFFGVGVLTGLVVTAGGGRRKSLPPIPGNAPSPK